MLMTLSCRAGDGFVPADLGYLVHKHPEKVQTYPVAHGQVHVFYPEVSPQRCRLSMLLEIDPVGLVRRAGQGLDQYVNDRPYAASSFFAVAMNRVFRDALGAKCKDRPELVHTPLDLEVQLSVVRCSPDYLRQLFLPLGYAVETQNHPLDPQLGWQQGPYHTVTLKAVTQLHKLLNHLYILLPVLDPQKHYYVDQDELEKLMRKGEGWLAQHPLKNSIVERYLKYRPGLTRDALARLQETPEDPEAVTQEADAAEEQLERPIRLHDVRLDRVCELLKQSGLNHVVDMGCGSGKLLSRLRKFRQFQRIQAVDVSYQALVMAKEKMRAEDARVEFLHGSLLYRDSRLKGCQAVALVEVIEHLDLPRLRACEKNLFGFLRPQLVVLTTPNRDYNVLFEGLSAGNFRHHDHRFEWTRAEFREWALRVAEAFGYRVDFEDLGEVDPALGGPSQMGVFRR
jgi:3' terminal RNA ribose 2'-O-methyltransferase Hen1